MINTEKLDPDGEWRLVVDQADHAIDKRVDIALECMRVHQPRLERIRCLTVGTPDALDRVRV